MPYLVNIDEVKVGIDVYQICRHINTNELVVYNSALGELPNNSQLSNAVLKIYELQKSIASSVIYRKG